MASGPVTLAELERLLAEFSPDRSQFPTAAYTTRAGWDRIRALLIEWRTEYRSMEPIRLWANEIPVYLDEDLEPGVFEFRDAAGEVLKRVTLPAVEP